MVVLKTFVIHRDGPSFDVALERATREATTFIECMEFPPSGVQLLLKETRVEVQPFGRHHGEVSYTFDLIAP